MPDVHRLPSSDRIGRTDAVQGSSSRKDETSNDLKQETKTKEERKKRDAPFVLISTRDSPCNSVESRNTGVQNPQKASHTLTHLTSNAE